MYEHLVGQTLIATASPARSRRPAGRSFRARSQFQRDVIFWSSVAIVAGLNFTDELPDCCTAVRLITEPD
jgi:hypothetical protein